MAGGEANESADREVPRPSNIELTARGVERLDAALQWARRELDSLGLEERLRRGRWQIALERLTDSGRYTVRLRYVGPKAYASARTAGRDLARAMRAAFQSVRSRLHARSGPPPDAQA